MFELGTGMAETGIRSGMVHGGSYDTLPHAARHMRSRCGDSHPIHHVTQTQKATT